MIHDPANAVAAASPSDTKLRGLLGGMSVFTMIMTVPQVWAIWVSHQAAGVSILSAACASTCSLSATYFLATTWEASIRFAASTSTSG